MLITVADKVYIVKCPSTGQGQVSPVPLLHSEISTTADGQADLHWTSWSSLGFQSSDVIFLARTDGYLCRLIIDHGKITSNISSPPGCSDLPVSGKVAAILMPDMTQLMACFGNQGAGLYVLSDQQHDILNIEQTAYIEALAPVNNAVSLASNASRRGTHIVCGREPAGALKEIRLGFNAEILPYANIEGLAGCTDVHILPRPAQCDAVLLFSFPKLPDSPATLAVSMSTEQVEDYDNSAAEHPLDLDQTTLATGSCSSHLCQITSKSMIIIPQTIDVDAIRLDMELAERILCAAVGSASNMAVIAIETLSADAPLWSLRLLELPGLNTHLSIGLESAPTAVLLSTTKFGMHVALTNADQSLKVFRMASGGTLYEAFSHRFSNDQDISSICDSLLSLDSDSLPDSETALISLACGLRNGRLHVLDLRIASSGAIQLERDRHLTLGATTVKVTAHSDPSSAATRMLATVDSHMHLVTCLHGVADESLVSSLIWTSDPEDPSFNLGAISVVAQMPVADVGMATDLDNALVVIGSNACVFSRLIEGFTNVPRSIAVTGTPSHLLYSTHLSHFVVAMTHTDIQQDESDGRPVAFTRGRLEFHTADGGSDPPPYFPLQAAERVYALTDWVYRSEDNKKYVFVLVGTGIVDDSGKSRGRIHLIQPMVRRGKIEGCSLATTIRHDVAVTALEVCGETRFVAGTESSLALYDYAVIDKKWVMAHMLKLGSHVVRINACGDTLIVATANDSIMRVTINESGATAVLQTESSDGGAHQVLDSLVSRDTPRHEPDYTIAITSTRQKQIRVLSIRPGVEPITCVASVQLHRSLTRIIQVDTHLVPGSPQSQIHGFSPDGTMTGLAPLDLQTWAVLRYIQTLCERRARAFRYNSQREAMIWRPDRAPLPLGLMGLEQYEDESTAAWEARTGCSRASGALEMVRWQPENAHVDGDVLQRVSRGGEALLRDLIEDVTDGMEAHTGDDRLGMFVRTYMDQEMKLVPDAMRLVDEWVGVFGRYDACARET